MLILVIQDAPDEMEYNMMDWLTMDWMKNAAALAAAVFAIVFPTVKYLSRRDRQVAAREAFRSVVKSLSSEIEAQRLGGAILLRRFLDPRSELGAGGTPYARESIDVIAALLRETETGNFQKLLADGLLFAPSLEGLDLQRTNLQHAYLGVRSAGAATNLRGADFYRADLSGASLKGADASKAVFYQARLHNTVLKSTNLSGASFFEADLLGAKFDGATLTKASFKRARNLPEELAAHIADDGAYTGPAKFEGQPHSGPRALSTVFISKPAVLTTPQGELLREVIHVLTTENVKIATVAREDYPQVGAVSEVRRVISGCCGMVVLGFSQLHIGSGTWRDGTEERRELKDAAMPTAWNHIEAGMAAMAGLPILVLVERSVTGELFDFGDVGQVVTEVDLLRPDRLKLRKSIQGWCHTVREQRTAPPACFQANEADSGS
jgi:uncharacterized protein YjbI with pentapeptide repeats